MYEFSFIYALTGPFPVQFPHPCPVLDGNDLTVTALLLLLPQSLLLLLLLILLLMLLLLFIV